MKSDQDDKTLRISIDAKANLKLGELSRGGKLRCFEAVKAADHDMEANGILVLFGILEVKQKQFNVVYGNSLETSDFIVDCLEHWWRYRKGNYRHIERLQLIWTTGRSWKVAACSSSNGSSSFLTRQNCRLSWFTMRICRNCSRINALQKGLYRLC